MTDSDRQANSDPPAASHGSRLAVLGYRDFRLLWGGELISTIGTQMQIFAITWQVLELLRGHTYTLALASHHITMQADALGLGALGLARVVPVLVLALLGGELADAHDRRIVITIAQAVAAANAALLALLSVSGHAGIAALYLLSATGVAASVFAQPAQQALVPALVRREHLANAYSLYALIWQVGTLIGPPLAGVIIAVSGFGTIYALDAVSFIAVLLAVRAMHHRPVVSERRTLTHRMAIREGLRFAHGSSLIWQTLLIDLYATFFASARAMVPLIATNVLHVGVRGYGLLASAQAVGAFIAGTLLTLRRDIQRQGIVLFVSVAAFGLAWMLFGLVNIFVLAYVLYSLTGATDTVSYVIRTTLRQSLTPDELRGRVAGIHMTLGDAGPALGELESGIVASLFSAPIAIVTGGFATLMLTVVAAVRWKGLRAYRSGDLGEIEHRDPAALEHVP